VKQPQHPSGAGVEDAITHRRRHGRPGIDQQLCARPAHEPLFSLWVAGIAIGARRHSEQAALFVVASPRKQRGVFGQQLLQAFDVVVVNDAASLLDRPLEALAEAFAHFSGEVLPAGVAVLTRDHELRIAVRQGQVDMWQVHSCTGDGLGVTGSDVAREFLCLFSKGLERRTSRKRLRSGHCAPLS
jgi:hypothetical protein